MQQLFPKMNKMFSFLIITFYIINMLGFFFFFFYDKFHHNSVLLMSKRHPKIAHFYTSILYCPLGTRISEQS